MAYQNFRLSLNQYLEETSFKYIYSKRKRLKTRDLSIPPKS
jgi:hypothetical protein